MSDNHFMELATLVSKQSTCLRRKVGAVAVKGGVLIASGCNGAPYGTEPCTHTNKCLRKELNVPSGERAELCLASHAEMNIIAHAAREGVSLRGATLYCTTMPCSICTKLIIGAGFKRVVYKDSYNDILSLQMLEKAGVIVDEICLIQ